ncbi:MAG: response regulator transcription factor [Sphingomonas sp.]|uniref:response regulator transcription factor n=1 Tax=Sphingomonas sp. TaxID=28214 RepID=UPI0025CE436E|nr:response regulator transcription factor [Sphingomonas sp.]MBX3564387.1 response regulator transcription factor [Sphingomonas sp.]
MSNAVLVIDDEDAIRLLVRRALDRDGHEVLEAGNASEGLSLARARTPAVVLLDLGLPDRDGLELVQPLVTGGAAVIVVTARDATAEKVAALDLGADDYVTKPFDTDELLARVRSALRRHRPGGGHAPAIDGLTIDEQAHRVTIDGKEVHLTPKEFALLALLARYPGRVVTHATLLRELWGPAHIDDIEYLRVAVRALRLKIEANPSAPTRLRNEPGVGYRFG